MRTSLAIVLAAGEGKRMRSDIPKALHPIGRLAMIGHLLKTLRAASLDRIAVVVGPGHEAVADKIKALAPAASVHVQESRRGTAHAALAARAALDRPADDVLVVFADTPFIPAAAIAQVREALAAGSTLVVGGMRPPEPFGYGRLIVENGQLLAIREERDASASEREIALCNSGLMGFQGEAAMRLLEAIGDDNDQREFYLTDAVEIANRRGMKVAVVEIAYEDAFGINDRAQLAEAEHRLQERMRRSAMLGGATLVAPQTVFFAHDTMLGRDVVIEPNVVFGEGVTVADNVLIRGFSHIEGARIASGAIVGPFARLRPGAEIGPSVHVGNFVEIKQASVEEGAKINHLAYVGDARVGAGANIGAGAITCNYDGAAKHHTDIGKGAFIGTNSSLVAPVTIGEAAYVASGSVITEDVEPGALAFGRARQVTKQGRAPKGTSDRKRG
jgi:bifunctional UDP-N-acetylglucosamine pyrophosphorylase/glucosamine-1-phosphate N-acetyltransferase